MSKKLSKYSFKLILVISGTSVSLSSDGSILAVGGFSDTFGFTPNFDVPEAYIVTLKGIGSAWIFTRNGTAYNEVGSKLVGTGFVGISPQQGEQEAYVCYINVFDHSV